MLHNLKRSDWLGCGGLCGANPANGMRGHKKQLPIGYSTGLPNEEASSVLLLTTSTLKYSWNHCSFLIKTHFLIYVYVQLPLIYPLATAPSSLVVSGKTTASSFLPSKLFIG